MSLILFFTLGQHSRIDRFNEIQDCLVGNIRPDVCDPDVTDAGDWGSLSDHVGNDLAHRRTRHILQVVNIHHEIESHSRKRAADRRKVAAPANFNEFERSECLVVFQVKVYPTAVVQPELLDLPADTQIRGQDRFPVSAGAKHHYRTVANEHASTSTQLRIECNCQLVVAFD